jgi:hypothetical protein
LLLLLLGLVVLAADRHQPCTNLLNSVTVGWASRGRCEPIQEEGQQPGLRRVMPCYLTLCLNPPAQWHDHSCVGSVARVVVALMARRPELLLEHACSPAKSIRRHIRSGEGPQTVF